MSERVPLPSIAGLLSGFVGLDVFAGHFAEASRLVGFQPAVNDAPSGGSVTVDLRTAPGGGGSALSATIADGDTYPTTPVTGLVEVPAATDLWLRITAATGSPLGFYGQYITESATPSVSTALTTLALVKEYLNITGAASDAFLTRVISAVSVKMQQNMRRKIVSETIVDEKTSVSNRSHLALVLRRYPVDLSSLVVTVSGTTLDSEDFDLETETGLLFYTPGGGSVTSWPLGDRHISLDYDAGFSSVPADLEYAATVQCAWENNRKPRLGDRTSVIGDNTATYLVDAWAPDVVPILDSYRARLI